MFRFKLVTQDYKTRAGCPNETTWEFGKVVEAKTAAVNLNFLSIWKKVKCYVNT